MTDSPERRFWAWFAANSARLLAFEQDQERVFAELGAALGQVAEGLTFEFGQPAPAREFVVSADGQRALFPAVQALVAAAPALPGWEIKVFRQPKGTRLTVGYGDLRLSPDDLWFRAEPHGERTGLTLYVRGLARQDEDFVRQASFLLLDAALGEYTVETRIGYIAWAAAPPDPLGAGLRSFHDLPQAISGWTKSA